MIIEDYNRYFNDNRRYTLHTLKNGKLERTIKYD